MTPGCGGREEVVRNVGHAFRSLPTPYLETEQTLQGKSLRCFRFPHPGQPGHTTWSLVLVGDDTTDEVGLRGPQVGHELVEVLLGVGRTGRGTGGAENHNWMPQWMGTRGDWAEEPKCSL